MVQKPNDENDEMAQLKSEKRTTNEPNDEEEKTIHKSSDSLLCIHQAEDEWLVGKGRA